MKGADQIALEFHESVGVEFFEPKELVHLWPLIVIQSGEEAGSGVTAPNSQDRLDSENRLI